MAERVVKVGIVGFGTVGSGVAKLILEDASRIAAKTGIRLELACVVDIDTTSPRPVMSRGQVYLFAIDEIKDAGRRGVDFQTQKGKPDHLCSGDPSVG